MGEKTMSLFNRVHDLSEEVNVQHNELAQLEREVKRLEAVIEQFEADIDSCAQVQPLLLIDLWAVVDAARKLVATIIPTGKRWRHVKEVRKALKKLDNSSDTLDAEMRKCSVCGYTRRDAPSAFKVCCGQPMEIVSPLKPQPPLLT